MDIRAADMPEADKFMVGIMALLADKERDMISQRTRDGLAAAKRRGTKLGNPRPQEAARLAVKAKKEMANDHAQAPFPIIRQIQKAHVQSLRGIAECLNARGFKTPTGKAFAAQSVKNALERIESTE